MSPSQKPNFKPFLFGAMGVVLGIVIVFALIAGVKDFVRYQAREDAKNEVTIEHTHVHKAEQAAEVVYAEIKKTVAQAKQRYQESIGLKRSQTEIDKSLTPLYVQHEYVQAIEKAAQSNSNTIEFIPVGANGIPIVQPTKAIP